MPWLLELLTKYTATNRTGQAGLLEVGRPSGLWVWVGVELIITEVTSFGDLPRGLIELTQGKTVLLRGKLVFGDRHRSRN